VPEQHCARTVHCSFRIYLESSVTVAGVTVAGVRGAVEVDPGAPQKEEA